MAAVPNVPASELGSRLKLHLDTDIGGDLDDLCALALVLAWPEVEITGITTVLEHAGRRAGYARYALDLAGRPDVPLAAGADVNLGRFELGAALPPEERYWPEPIASLPGPLDAALDLLQHSIELGAAIVGIGPLTNLALLEQRSPGTLGRARVWLMGGHVRPVPTDYPGWDHTMDYNIQCDPAAARQVLESSTCVGLVPIEVSVETALRRDHLAALERGGPLARLIAHQAAVFAKQWNNEARYGRINFQHDGLACAAALGWPGVTLEPLPIALDYDGPWLRMRVAPGGRTYHVASAVDGAAFDALWLTTVTGGPRSARAPQPAPAV